MSSTRKWKKPRLLLSKSFSQQVYIFSSQHEVFNLNLGIFYRGLWPIEF